MSYITHDVSRPVFVGEWWSDQATQLADDPGLRRLDREQKRGLTFRRDPATEG